MTSFFHVFRRRVGQGRLFLCHRGKSAASGDSASRGEILKTTFLSKVRSGNQATARYFSSPSKYIFRLVETFGALPTTSSCAWTSIQEAWRRLPGFQMIPGTTCFAAVNPILHLQGYRLPCLVWGLKVWSRKISTNSNSTTWVFWLAMNFVKSVNLPFLSKINSKIFQLNKV